MSAGKMLSVEALETFYGQSQVLFGVDLAIAEGQVATLLGRNGMGKTTTVKSVMGMIPARAGRIRFGGRTLDGLPSYRIAQAGLGLVPEGRQIFPNLTVYENLVATAANRRGDRNPWTLERIFGVFENLRARKNNYGNQLSGGEQQMLAIGRALMTNPQLLVLDEATEGLAPLVRAEIWRCLDALKRDGLTLIVIDKNIAPLSRLADRHYIVEKGRVAWHGNSTALLADPALLHQYLGV